MDELVRQLSTGRHPVAAVRAQSSTDLAESVARGYLLLTFTGTDGGTELGIELDKERSVLDQADFASGHGAIHLVGRSTLNDDPVELRADLDLATLRGEGSLAL